MFRRLLAAILGLAVIGGAVALVMRALGGSRPQTSEATSEEPPTPPDADAADAADAAVIGDAPTPEAVAAAVVQQDGGQSFLFDRWPRFACRHPWPVIVGALLTVVATGVIWAVAGGEFGGGGFVLPGAESQRLTDLLEERFPEVAGDSAEAVIRAPAGVESPEMRPRVEALVAQARELPQVVNVLSPFDTPGFISPDGTIARILLQYAGDADTVRGASMSALFDWREESSVEDLQVELGGIVAIAGEREPPGSAELVGLGAAAIILLVAFGTVTAAGLPIVTALLALIPTFFLIGIGASIVNFADFTPQFAAMIGIGVGIDYALLIVTRFREALAEGLDVTEAVVKAAGTAGHSVLFAGCSVVIALMGLWALGVPLLSLTAMGPALAVALAAVVAIFVLPAMLGLVGHRINRLSLPGLRFSEVEHTRGFGYRLSHFIGRAPWLWLVLGAAVMLVLAYPALDARLGSSDAGHNPTSLTTRRSYDLLAEGFGVGVNGPIVIGAALDTPAAVEAFEALPEQLRGQENVAGVSPVQPNVAGTAAIITLIPVSAPQDAATDDLVRRLRRELPQQLEASGAQVLIGGPQAVFIDIAERVTSRMAAFLSAVIGVSFLLLLIVFRSLLVPIKAAIMNVLAAGAAYGILVAIFQWGWAAGILGVEGTGPIEPFLPMMMFAVLFGLSMDYEVFLVSRVREEYLVSGDNGESVARGLAATSRVITAAAAIMVAVFFSFALSDQRVIKEFGIGLAVAIFLDATIIRLVLVPAAMQVGARANWWLPGWLDRLVPNLDLSEGGVEPDHDRELAEPATGAK